MRALAAATLVSGTFALLVAGCGGGSGSTTRTSASLSTTDWANSVCGSLVTWTTTRGASRQSRVQPHEVRRRGHGQTGRDRHQDPLHRPQGARQARDRSGPAGQGRSSALTKELSADAASIQTSIVTGTLSAVATASDTLSAMGHQVAATFGELQKLGAKGESSRRPSRRQPRASSSPAKPRLCAAGLPTARDF